MNAKKRSTATAREGAYEQADEEAEDEAEHVRHVCHIARA